jgi:thiol-disulfide isomerase/thioredoxin
LGAAVLVAVVAIMLGADTGFLTRVSLGSTASLEQGLLDRFHTGQGAQSANGAANGGAMTGNAMMMSGNAHLAMQANPPAQSAPLPIEDTMPSLAGVDTWLNSPPLTIQALKGKVVLIDFWTYSCINCLRSIPYVRAWAEKYQDQGLVVIGVHTPEFAFERNIDNVKKAVAELKIGYPVAIDNDYAVWRAFENQYWPAHYLIDAQGRVRYHQFGEGDYDQSERAIQQLLAEAGKPNVPGGLVTVTAMGAEAAADTRDTQSPETYIGYDRGENFVSSAGTAQGVPHDYAVGTLRRNEWGLSGDWTRGGEHADLDAKDGSIVYRFHARDVHLVLGPPPDGKAVPFRITIDGAPPGDSHGADTDADGRGVVTEHRLYQLVRQTGAITDHTFEIRFLDPGVQAYAFTFG